ncbi:MULTISPECIES: DUF2934 domain-containing protein [unclassified Mesorhizobium]|uniref:DUF2934 domain-containing protein n=1 Tax=unclassified Mesorhizobium TaxID=325217 RepID=UPI0003CF2366|nr:DUF2934 domain-containing protein [Mesorhizobium sp. LSHC420B00]ESX64915.1 hypothetical protein X759_29750 [Mesorhizobium sp. LSHC420B00]
MDDDRHEKIRQRAYEIWVREGRPHGEHERHWQQAKRELDLDDADRGPAGVIASSDVLTVEALAMRTGITGDQAQELIDRLGNDRAALEEAARNLKAAES